MFEKRIQRLFQATGVQTDSELARVLDIQPPSVAGARKRQLLPGAWVEKIALDYGVCADWLLFGRGPMRPGEAVPTAQDSAPAPQVAPEAPVAAQESTLARCTKLEARLDEVERERRELTMENRQMAAENRNLWKENGELREKCARLEERQYRVGIKHGDAEVLGGAG